ncbi:hypothetical protein IC620_06195 [Hazenella sp. IB182357]|uniref:Uncharacterized protein n=1 Tax=Polycladospora coralii TaxID=2771432 RepID=A0A926NE88_9BACL|nr:hypothetical protein [Polycladospora coralii]MBD1371949.1 hypothetical protein [Polycladospora coralii]
MNKLEAIKILKQETEEKIDVEVIIEYLIEKGYFTVGEIKILGYFRLK